MRTSTIIAVSLPPAMARASEAWAKKRYMTRSEFMRGALRNYLEQIQREEAQADAALRSYEREKASGKLKELKGSLVDMMD